MDDHLKRENCFDGAENGGDFRSDAFGLKQDLSFLADIEPFAISSRTQFVKFALDCCGALALAC